MVQLEAVQRSVFRPPGLHRSLPKGLAATETGVDREQANAPPGASSFPALQIVGILQPLTQHLHPSANGQHVASMVCVASKLLFQAAGSQGVKVPKRLLAARKDHGIGLAKVFTRLHPAQPQACFGFQRIQIGEVAQGGQA